MIKDYICDLRNADRSFIGRNILLQMNKSDLRDLNGVLFGWNYLLHDHKVNLRNVNRAFICGNDLVDSDVVDLRKLDGLLVSFSLWYLDFFYFSWSLWGRG